jgi:ribose/xylose/arabinose/galactoside ABC-type transport system permease subunit
MDPWEIVVIVLASIIGFAILAFAGFTFRSSIGSFLLQFVYALVNFIPLGLISFGFMTDMIGQEFRYSIPSIMAICAVIINSLVGNAFSGYLPPITPGVSDESGPWCFVPGLEVLESRFLPMNFIVMGSILTYYLVFALLNRPIGTNISLLVLFFLFPIMQGAAFALGGCNKWYAWGTAGNFGSWIAGILFGLSAYAIVNSINPAATPFADLLRPVPVGPASGYQSRGPMGPPPTGAKCSAADTEDDNAFVCEAYKNGVLVTEKIS